MKAWARFALDAPEHSFPVDVMRDADGWKVLNPRDGFWIPVKTDSDGRNWVHYPADNAGVETLVAFLRLPQ